MRGLADVGRGMTWARGAVASLLAFFLVATTMPMTAQAVPAGAGAIRAEAALAAEVLQEIDTARGFWDAAGVASSVQRRLEAGLRAGDLPESMTSGSVPVRTTATRQDGNRVETATFSDGSVYRTLVQEASGVFDDSALGLPKDKVSTMASYDGTIRSCENHSGAGFAVREDCAIKGSNGGGITLGFIASYMLVQGTYNDEIMSRHSAYQQCNGAVCDAPTWNRWVKKESRSDGRALVSMTSRWEVAGVSSGTAELKLVVGANTAYARLSV